MAPAEPARALRIALALGGTDRGRSGISTFVRAVLPGLRQGAERSGGSLTVFGAAEDRDAFADGLRGLDFHATPRAFREPGPNALWHLLAAGPFAKRLRADVLLLPAANRRLTLRSPIPTVAVVHDLAQLRVSAKFDRLRMFYARQVMIRSLARASELVSVSEATRADLCEALGCPRDRVRVVSNGVDAQRFSPHETGSPQVETARARLGLERDYLLYAARLEHPGKNHLRLLQAFARSRAAEGKLLALAGADFGGGAAIRAEIARLGLGARVRCLGFVPDELLPALVAGADATLMVGLHEGFGLPALESLAAGRPLVASNTGALPEVTGALAALCDPSSVESIEAAIGKALTDAPFRAAAREQGPAWARARGWDKTAQGLLEACQAARRNISFFSQAATKLVSI